MHAATADGSTVTPKRRDSQPAAASRNAGDADRRRIAPLGVRLRRGRRRPPAGVDRTGCRSRGRRNRRRVRRPWPSARRGGRTGTAAGRTARSSATTNSAEPGRGGVVEPRPHAHVPLVLGLLRRAPRPRGARRRGRRLGRTARASSTTAASARSRSPIGAQQFVDAVAGGGRHGDGPGAGSARRCAPPARRSALLNASSSGTRAAADLAQHRAHGVDLLVGLDGRRVDDVDEQVGFGRHFERRLERLDELVRQLADEPDGVGQQHRLASRAAQAPGSGVERREQPVLDEHAGVGEVVQQRRLAGVRVPDDGHVAEPDAAPTLALVGAVAVDLAELVLELVDAALDPAPVDLELRLTGAAAPDRCSGAAAGGAGARLLRERRPAPAGEAAGSGAAPARPAPCPPGWRRSGRRCRGSPRCGRWPCGPSSFSRLNCCAGVSSLSNTTVSQSVASDTSRSSSTLPLPTYVAGSGASRRCTTRATSSAPAVSTSWLSSSSDASTSSRLVGRDRHPHEHELLPERPIDERHGYGQGNSMLATATTGVVMWMDVADGDVGGPAGHRRPARRRRRDPTPGQRRRRRRRRTRRPG